MSLLVGNVLSHERNQISMNRSLGETVIKHDLTCVLTEGGILDMVTETNRGKMVKGDTGERWPSVG